MRVGASHLLERQLWVAVKVDVKGFDAGKEGVDIGHRGSDGGGEAAMPPVGGALANAIFDATGVDA